MGKFDELDLVDIKYEDIKSKKDLVDIGKRLGMVGITSDLDNEVLRVSVMKALKAYKERAEATEMVRVASNTSLVSPTRSVKINLLSTKSPARQVRDAVLVEAKSTVQGQEQMDDFSSEEDPLYENIGGDDELSDTERPNRGRKRARTSPNHDSVPKGGLERLEVAMGALVNWAANYRAKTRGCNKEALTEIISELRVSASDIRERDAFLRGMICQGDELKEMIRYELGNAVGAGGSEAPRVSFADKVKGVPRLTIPKAKDIPARSHLVAVYPGKDVNGAPLMEANATRTIIRECVKPSTESLHIKNMKEIRQGGVLLVTGSAEDARKILNHEVLRNRGLLPKRPKSMAPKVMIYDLPEELNDNQARNCLFEQNPDGRPDRVIFENNFKLVKTIKGREEGQRHWVVECSAPVRNWLCRGDRVYIEWNSCRVKDYADVSRCYKCQGYGHVSKYCREKVMCGHCTGEHDTRECPTKDDQVQHPCAACKKAGKDGAGHSTSSRDCPMYLRAVQDSVRRTDYGC